MMNTHNRLGDLSQLIITLVNHVIIIIINKVANDHGASNIMELHNLVIYSTCECTIRRLYIVPAVLVLF